MIQEIACLLHHQRCKDTLRAIHIQDLKITLLHKIPEFPLQTKINNYDLLIVDSKHHDSESLLKHISTNKLYNSTIIVIPQFDRETFQRYIKLGYRYVIDIETFVYLIPIILDNLIEFIQNDFHSPKEITKKGLTISIECGYIIFHGCKITTSRPALILLCAILNSDRYCNWAYLQTHLNKAIGQEVSSSYITVTISRLNREIYKATGLRIIRNRYGFGYYIDL